MLTMAQFPFAEIAGVDLSGEMLRVARTNAERAGVDKKMKFHQMDAAQFRDFDRFTHIYFYHPFPEVVMKEVIANLAQSLTRAPRRLVLIYKNPQEHSTVMGSGLF